MPDAPVKARGRKREKPAEGVNWESRKASKVTTDDVAKLHKAIGAASKTTTANRIVEIVSAVYNVAQRDKLIGDMNPAKGVEPFSEAKRDRHLSSDESTRFMDALKAEPLDWQDFFMLLLLTGQRLMNVAGMRWRDVDLQAGTWSLAATQTKQKAPVIIPLTDQAAEILKRRSEAAGKGAAFVFPADSATGHVSRPQKRWKALVTRAGLDGLRKHDLRHTAASWLAQRGASLAVIGAALGHRDIQSTMRYAHMVIDPVRQAMQSAHDGALGSKPVKPVVTAKLIRFKRRAAR
jgi:integrase